MNSNSICPISSKKINEYVARANAAITVLFLLIYVLTFSVIPVVVLAIDFLLRGAELSKYSPFAIFSKSALNLFAVQPKPINAGPKIFAARIGFAFTVAVLFFHLAGYETAAWVVASIFGVCAFLESAFGFCVACQVYPFVYKLTYNSKVQKLKI